MRIYKVGITGLLKVTGIRYFETNRGLGYQCTTNIKGIEICNDGTGGATYLKGALQNTYFLKEYTESKLEYLIDQYELQRESKPSLTLA
jgi:hypothetical protein